MSEQGWRISCVRGKPRQGIESAAVWVRERATGAEALRLQRAEAKGE